MSILRANNQAFSIPDCGGHELAMSLRRAYLSMHRATNTCFVEHGLSADSFTVLTVLADFGSMTQNELTGKIGSDANTVSAMITRLERLKLIERKRSSEDGRARIAELTDEGRKIQKTLWDKSQTLRVKMENLFETNDLLKIVIALNRLAWLMDHPDEQNGKEAKHDC